MASTTSLIRSFGHFIENIYDTTLRSLKSAWVVAWDEFANFIFNAFWVVLILIYTFIVVLLLVLTLVFIF